MGTRFSACPDRPCGPSSLMYNGYWVSSKLHAFEIVTILVSFGTCYARLKKKKVSYCKLQSKEKREAIAHTVLRDKTLDWLKMKGQLDVTYYFISLLVCSTYFGH